MAIASMFLMFPAEAVSVILRNDERLLGRRNPNLASEKFGAKGTKGKQYFFLNIWNRKRKKKRKREKKREEERRREKKEKFKWKWN